MVSEPTPTTSAARGVTPAGGSASAGTVAAPAVKAAASIRAVPAVISLLVKCLVERIAIFPLGSVGARPGGAWEPSGPGATRSDMTQPLPFGVPDAIAAYAGGRDIRGLARPRGRRGSGGTVTGEPAG